MNINLSKEQSREQVKIHLKKSGYADGIVAKVCLVLDESGSMQSLYNNGTVQALVDRALSVGYIFDDDGAIDVFSFAHDDEYRQLDQATQDDFGSYLKGFSPVYGGTDYSPVLREVERFYYTGKKAGFIGNLFGKKSKDPEGRDGSKDKHPVYVIFITDGETHNENLHKKEIKAILKNNKDMFIQFIGVGNNRFSFLKQMAEDNKNAGFAKVSKFKDISEDELLKVLLPEEAKAIIQ